MDFDFSVIIPAYNGGDTLRWCLEGVFGQDYRGAFEVLVVESGDGSYIAGFSADFPRVRFVRAPFRLYSGQARNVGALYAAGRALVFLDADCRPLPGWLETLDEVHRKGFGVVSGSLENGTPGSIMGTAEYLVSKSFYSPAIPSRIFEYSTASSANMSVSREAFDSAGGFPGTKRANDFLFSRKLHESGVTVFFCSGAVAAHLNPTVAGQYLRGQVERGYWNGVARIHNSTRGSAARRFPPLALMLFFLRLYRMIMRCVRYEVVRPATLLRLLPLCTAGLAAWTLGYFRASMQKHDGLPELEALPRQWRDFDIICGETPVDAD